MTLLRIEPELQRTALVLSDEVLSYLDFWDAVAGETQELRTHDRASRRYKFILERDPVGHLLLAMAALKLGAAPCPVNPSITDETFLDLVGLLGVASGAGRPKRKKKVHETGLLVEREDAVFDAALVLERDEPVFAVLTSGTTGASKVAVLSGGDVCASARNANRVLGLTARDRWLLSLPLHHVSGIGVVFRSLLASAAIAVPSDDEPLAAAIERTRPTHVSLVATQLYRLLRDETAAAALARCKGVVMGGGPTPESLVREAVARGIPLVMSYGMTETAAMICCTRPGDPLERLLSSGKPLVDGTVSISDDGEILVRGDQLFLGYLQPDGSLDRPLTDDGWFRTGDLGHFDNAGYLHVTGRKDSMFISGGENIQPEEIESALHNLDGVEEAIVVAVDDEEWGRRPVAFLRMAEGRTFDAAALQQALRGVLPGYKVPRAYHALPEVLAQPGLKPARRDFESCAKERSVD
jgi:O-succinylbenzoic acid--CoA ligase